MAKLHNGKFNPNKQHFSYHEWECEKNKGLTVCCEVRPSKKKNLLSVLGLVYIGSKTFKISERMYKESAEGEDELSL